MVLNSSAERSYDATCPLTLIETLPTSFKSYNFILTKIYGLATPAAYTSEIDSIYSDITGVHEWDIIL